MGILLSEIAKKNGILDYITIVNEKQFDCFARATTRVDGEKCIFVENSRYLDVIDSSVKMIITTPEIAQTIANQECGVCIAQNVRGTFFELMSLYEHDNKRGEKETAVGVNCTISKTAKIAEKNVTIGNNVSIGDYVVIHPNVTIGDNTVIQTGAKIGEQDFNVYSYGGKTKQIYHGGEVCIGNNVLISSGVLIGQALYSYGKTIINDNSFIGAGTCVGHNTEIGAGCEICGNSMIGGFCKIGSKSKLYMTVTLANALQVGSNVTINVGSVVIRDIEDGKTVFGNPARVIVSPSL